MSLTPGKHSKAGVARGSRGLGVSHNPCRFQCSETQQVSLLGSTEKLCAELTSHTVAVFSPQNSTAQLTQSAMTHRSGTYYSEPTTSSRLPRAYARGQKELSN